MYVSSSLGRKKNVVSNPGKKSMLYIIPFGLETILQRSKPWDPLHLQYDWQDLHQDRRENFLLRC